MSDGTRRVTHISEITGTSGDVISMQDIYLFEKLGLGHQRKRQGPLLLHRHRAQVRRTAEGVRDCAAAEHDGSLHGGLGDESWNDSPLAREPDTYDAACRGEMKRFVRTQGKLLFGVFVCCC